MCVCVCARPFVRPSDCLSACLSVCLSVHMYVCMFVFLFLSVVCLFFCLTVFLFFLCLSVCPFVCLPVVISLFFEKGVTFIYFIENFLIRPRRQTRSHGTSRKERGTRNKRISYRQDENTTISSFSTQTVSVHTCSCSGYYQGTFKRSYK